jgi:hypothetical protein
MEPNVISVICATISLDENSHNCFVADVTFFNFLSSPFITCFRSDLDTVKELLPIIVTTIIIASCVVTVCLLSSGLVKPYFNFKFQKNCAL